MRTVISFVTLLSASALVVCVAQVPAPATTSGPQVIIEQPQITYTAPRAAFKKRPTTAPAPSSAPASVPQAAATASDTQEVTVTGHRPTEDPDWEDGRGRMFIESRPPPEVQLAVGDAL